MVQTDVDDLFPIVLTHQGKPPVMEEINLKTLTERNDYHSQPSGSANIVADDGQATLMESLANSMTEFIYDPEANQTFYAWYTRYEDLFSEDGKKLDVAAKVRLLLRKLSSVVYTKYSDYVLPNHPRDFDFVTTVEMLKKLFGCSDTLFSMRYKCLQTVKRDCDDLTTYAALVNRRCEDFQLKSLTSDQFKCLTFIMGLQSPRDTAVRASLLKLLHSDNPEHPVTLDSLVNEYQRIGGDFPLSDKQFLETSKTFQTLKSGTFKPDEVEKALNYMKTVNDRQIQDQIAAAFLEGVTVGRKSQTTEPKTSDELTDINTDLTGMLKTIIENGNELITRSEKYMETLKPLGHSTKVVYHDHYVINYNSTDEKKKFMVYDIKEECITKYNRACALFEMILNGLPPAIASSFNKTLMAKISEIINVDTARLNSINVADLTKVLAIMYRNREQS